MANLGARPPGSSAQVPDVRALSEVETPVTPVQAEVQGKRHGGCPGFPLSRRFRGNDDMNSTYWKSESGSLDEVGS